MSYFVIWSNYKVRGPFNTFDEANEFRAREGISVERSTVLDTQRTYLDTAVKRKRRLHSVP